MPKYILLYKGQATDMSAMAPEAVEAEMAKWGEWMGRVGPQMIDPGAPFSVSTSVVDDGSEGTASSLTGYGIVEAADLEGAKAHCKGHPYLADGNGDFAIDVFELVDMPTP